VADISTKLTVRELLGVCAAAIGGSEADSDATEIVSSVLDVSRSWPTLHEDEVVGETDASDALVAARLRAQGAPIQYAVGKAAFRHLTLDVDKRVLIPRPETEMLVDIVLERVRSGSVADVCTGSGAIALALATEGSYDRVIATDWSNDALDVARKNAARLEKPVRGMVEFRHGSFLSPLAGELLDAVVSNPPYIADDEMESLPPEVREWEPDAALRSGRDGLDAIRAITAGAPEVLKPGALLAVEVDTRRAGAASDILRADGRYEKIEILDDLTGRARFVIARRV
jgi:release factor glutamine methyltransferase